VLQRKAASIPASSGFPLAHEAAKSSDATAIRSMMGMTDAGTRYPQKFRIVCCRRRADEPEAIRWFRGHYA